MKRNFLNSLISGMITSTLVFSPSVFAKTNSEVNPKVEEMKQILNVGKYETAKSYAEVWGRISKKIPAQSLKNAKSIFSILNNEKYPNMKFQEFKYKGRNAIKLITDMGGEKVVVEYLFNGNEVMKVNGTLLTAADLKTIDTLNKKIGHLSFVKKSYTNFKKSVFSKSFTPDLKTWANFTPRQKAEYLLRYRQLLEASKKVFNKEPLEVVSQRNPANDSYAQAFLLGEEAFAAQAEQIGTKGKKSPAQQSATTEAVLDEAESNAEKAAAKLKETEFLGKGKSDGSRKGPSCIIAGYAMEWSGNSCKWNGRKDEVFNSEESKACQKSHGSAYVACQPITYINQDGGPVCVNTKTELQNATHSDGSCEKGSDITSVEGKKKYLDGWLKKIDPTGKLNKQDGKPLVEVKDGKLYANDKDLYNRITGKLITPLTNYIESAYSVCSKESGDSEATPTYKYKHSERNPKISKDADPAKQNKACDALVKRALAIQNLLLPLPDSTESGVIASTECKDWSPEGSAVMSPANKCVCKAGYVLGDKEKTCKQHDDGAVVAIPDPPKVETVDVTEEVAKETADENCSFYQRRNADNTCSLNGPMIASFALLIGVAACYAGKLPFEMCKDKDDKDNKPKYTDPAPSVDPSTPVTPVTPVTPTTPSTTPREEQTNPATVNGAADSVR